MRKKIVLLFAALFTLTSCSVNSSKNQNQKTETDSLTRPLAQAAAIRGVLSIKDTIKVGGPVNLRFVVHNVADTVARFCKWHTPFEPLLSKYLDIVDEDGEEVIYQGAMAKRVMPPPAESYIKIAARDSISGEVDLLKGYGISKVGKYRVTYVGENMSGVAETNSVSFVYIK